MKLVIKGNESKIKRLAKELKLRLKRDGLDYEIKGKKLEELSKDKSNDSDLPKGANDRIELINAVEKIEDLKPFESDDRATVKKAYDAKLEELSKDK